MKVENKPFDFLYLLQHKTEAIIGLMKILDKTLEKNGDTTKITLPVLFVQPMKDEGKWMEVRTKMKDVLSAGLPPESQEIYKEFLSVVLGESRLGYEYEESFNIAIKLLAFLKTENAVDDFKFLEDANKYSSTFEVTINRPKFINWLANPQGFSKDFISELSKFAEQHEGVLKKDQEALPVHPNVPENCKENEQSGLKAKTVEKSKIPQPPEVLKSDGKKQIPHFDKESGKFTFNEKTIKLGKGDLQYKLVEFLYDNPNRMFPYIEIAVAIGSIEKIAKKAMNPVFIEEARKLKKEGRKGAAKIIEQLGNQPVITAFMKKRINQLVSDIKKRLSLLKKDESLFVCNKGYMMKI